VPGQSARGARRATPATRKGKAHRTSGDAPSNGSSPADPISAGGKVVIELSRRQINQVCRVQSAAGNLTVPMSKLTGMLETLTVTAAQRGDSGFSQSLLVGLVVLASFPTDDTYLGNLELARKLDMNPSTAHRYLSTLVVAGLLERNPDTRRYRLAW
jgi:hypothetical protein